MESMFRGKVAIVTGSSAGLGETIALMFAARGASVTLCGRDDERLKSVLDKAVNVSGGHHERFLTVQGDVTDKSIRKQIVDQTVETFGRLDILVANAGITGTLEKFLDETEEAYNTLMDLNLKSVFFLIQQAVPYLEKTRGNVVNISSVASEMALRNLAIYSMSKAALDQLTRCLAVDLGPKGIRVNTVSPGYFQTLILRRFADADLIDRTMTMSQNEKQALKGRNGVNEDVAEAVTFLASEAAGFITGEVIKVDGGRSYGGDYDWKP